ncbi:MAG: serine/threonine-protein kinase [Myxococcales bacterium]
MHRRDVWHSSTKRRPNRFGPPRWTPAAEGRRLPGWKPSKGAGPRCAAVATHSGLLLGPAPSMVPVPEHYLRFFDCLAASASRLAANGFIPDRLERPGGLEPGRIFSADTTGIRRESSAPKESWPMEDPSIGSDKTLISETQRPGETMKPGATKLLPRGTAIGRYLVLEQLGAGGMGVVYAAYDPQLDRRVAIKLLRTDSAAPSSADEKARLQREAQALARLSHPNVVAVHDVGEAGTDTFVAMELVDGCGLDDWLAREKPTWREIVAKFLQAAQGLSAAHAAGIVHRDFKPSNVIVGGDGRVRVLDFGLACGAGAAQLQRSPEQDPAQDPARRTGSLVDQSLTVAGSLMGTPVYMSPEQIQGQPTDARTDQFSFCVALYEALYQTLPFASESDDLASMWEAVRAGQVRDAPEGSPVPAWLRAVLLRGLRPQASERYPTMEALCGALRLDPGQRRRRRLTMAAAALTLGLATVGLGAGIARYERPCRGADAKLVGVWDGTRREAVRQSLVATGAPFAEDAFKTVARTFDAFSKDWTAMRQSACEATHVRGEQSEELLDLRMECLDGRLQQLKAAADLLAQADRNVAERAVQLAQGLGEVSECADTARLRMPVRPPTDPAVQRRISEARDRLARIGALTVAGKYRDGLPLARAALDEAMALGWRPLQAEALYQVGQLEYYLGDYGQSEKTLRRALNAGQAGRHDVLAEDAARLLAFVVGTRLARPAEALLLVDEAAALQERVGENDLQTAKLLRTSARIHADLGQRAQAIEALTRAIALLDASVPAQAREQGNSSLELANLLRLEGKFAQAHASLERTRTLWLAALGPEHPSMGTVSMHLGNLLWAEDRLAEAAAAHEASLANLERAYGPKHALVGDALFNLGLVHERRGAFSKSLSFFDRALAVYRPALGDKNPSVGKTIEARCLVKTELGRYSEAAADCQRSFDILNGSDAVYAQLTFARLLALQGQDAASWEHAEQARALSEKTLGPKDLLTAKALRAVAASLGRLGRCKEALDAHSRAAALQAEGTPASRDRAEALQERGETLLVCGEPGQAVESLEEALKLRGVGEVRPDLLAETRFALARALWASSGDRQKARQLALQAQREFVASEGALMETKAAEVATWLARHSS